MSAHPPTPNASGAAAFDQLQAGLDPVGVCDERRDRPRYAWKTTLTAWVIDEPERDRGVRKVTVETIDISQTGFGFLYRQYIHPGAVIRTRLDTLPGAPIIDGIVAHCEHVGNSLHRVGVQFVKSAS